MNQPAFRIELTEADKDHVVGLYRELGSMELTRYKVRLPQKTIRAVLAERGVMKRAKKGASTRGVEEKESDSPIGAAARIGKTPLFDLIEETLPTFRRATMRYRDRTWNLDDLVREVNRQRKLLGMPQVDYNPAWLV